MWRELYEKEVRPLYELVQVRWIYNEAAPYGIYLSYGAAIESMAASVSYSGIGTIYTIPGYTAEQLQGLEDKRIRIINDPNIPYTDFSTIPEFRQYYDSVLAHINANIQETVPNYMCEYEGVNLNGENETMYIFRQHIRAHSSGCTPMIPALLKTDVLSCICGTGYKYGRYHYSQRKRTRHR